MQSPHSNNQQILAYTYQQANMPKDKRDMRVNHMSQCPLCSCELVFRLTDERYGCQACYTIYEILREVHAA